jgi:DNA mismatch repair protein MutL
LEDEILITTACHASIKAGEKLSIWQIDDLLEKWSTCKFPQTCPHGRKISHIIPLKDVAGYFGRSV